MEYSQMSAWNIGIGYYQTPLIGVARGFSPVGGDGLVKDVSHMSGDCPDCDDQLASNLPVSAAHCNQSYDIYLSLGQAVRKCRYSRCDRLRFFLKCR